MATSGFFSSGTMMDPAFGVTCYNCARIATVPPKRSCVSLIGLLGAELGEPLGLHLWVLVTNMAAHPSDQEIGAPWMRKQVLPYWFQKLREFRQIEPWPLVFDVSFSRIPYEMLSKAWWNIKKKSSYAAFCSSSHLIFVYVFDSLKVLPLHSTQEIAHWLGTGY